MALMKQRGTAKVVSSPINNKEWGNVASTSHSPHTIDYRNNSNHLVQYSQSISFGGHRLVVQSSWSYRYRLGCFGHHFISIVLGFVELLFFPSHISAAPKLTMTAPDNEKPL